MAYMNQASSPQLLRNNSQQQQQQAFQRNNSIKLTSRDTVAIDGSVLLGLNNTRDEYLYATKYHVKDRDAQRRSASSTTDVTSSCGCSAAANHNVSLMSRVVYCMAARWSIAVLHIVVLFLGVGKMVFYQYIGSNQHHATRDQTAPTPSPAGANDQDGTGLHVATSAPLALGEFASVILMGYTALETALSCIIIILLAIKTKCFFHDAKRIRQRLEYADLPGTSRGKAMTKWLYFYMFLSAFFVLVSVSAVAVLHLLLNKPEYHLYTVLVNNLAIIVCLTCASSGHSRLTSSIARASIDQHKIVLHEAVSFLQEVYNAVMTIPGLNRDSLMGGGGAEGHKIIHLTTRANKFLSSLQATKELQCPNYIGK